MEEFDFSIDGMKTMQMHDLDKISGWLMHETRKVRSSVLANLKKNPENGSKLIRNFSFMVKKHVFITDKRVFRERWRMNPVEFFDFVTFKGNDDSLTKERLNIYKQLKDELDNSIWGICDKAEDELFEAYQDQRIDPVNRHIEIKKETVTPLGYYLNFENKKELIKELKIRYPDPTGVKCARMIIALHENDLLILPKDIIDLYHSIEIEWGIKFKRTGIDKKLGDMKFYSDKGKQLYTNTEIVEINYIKDIRNNLLRNSTE
jgi:hypothetical protein